MDRRLPLSACIEWLFADEEDTIPGRVHAAARAGLDAVEIWGWRDKDLDGLRAALSATGLPLVSMVSEPKGRLVDPSTHETFVAGVDASSRVARSLGCQLLIVVAGDSLSGVDRQAQRHALVAGLRAAAPVAERAGVTLTLEPLNTAVDHPGYFLDRTLDAWAVLDEVDHPRVRLLYDLYHSAVMGEDPARVLDGRVGQVAHAHVADHPGRHEPGSGDVDWGTAIGWLRRSGYDGHVGLEYRPSRPTAGSLGYLRDLTG